MDRPNDLGDAKERKKIMYKLMSSTKCSWCKQAKSLLDAKKIQYEEILLDTASEDIRNPALDLMRTHHLKEVPQLFLKDGGYIGNFDTIQELVNQYNGQPSNSAGWSIREQVK